MFYDPRCEPHGLAHGPWMALIAPRPIAWISTVSAEGQRNLAPYSAFNTVASSPPFVMFSSFGPKDTSRNIEETRQFCVNIAGEALKDAMNATSADYPPEVDEFEVAGVAAAHCKTIDVPRVADAPIAIECILQKVVTLEPSTGAECINRIIFGEVVGVHIADHIQRDGKVATDLLRPIARLGYRDYCTVTETYEMIRPDPNQISYSTAQRTTP